MRILTTSDLAYVSGGDSENNPSGGSGCTSEDSPESCAAYQRANDACAALGWGLEQAASIFGNKPAETLAAEVAAFCQNAARNYVNWQYKSAKQLGQTNFEDNN